MIEAHLSDDRRSGLQTHKPSIRKLIVASIEKAAQLMAERRFIAMKTGYDGGKKRPRSQARQGERVSGLGAQQREESELRTAVAVAERMDCVQHCEKMCRLADKIAGVEIAQ
jgi:hypothetical protein